MNERPIFFNHDYLCQMLQHASDFDLANVILDVKKEQIRRSEEARQEYSDNILQAIQEAVDSGYMVKISTDDGCNTDCTIHSNNLFLTCISIECEEDE